MELNFKLDLEIAKEAGTGGQLTTGVHTVTIEKAYAYKSENGNNLLDLELKSDKGEVGFVNRICMDEKWTSGTENVGYAKFMEFAACAEMQSVTLVPTKRKTKNGEVDANVIKELMGKTLKVAVYKKKDVYTDDSGKVVETEALVLQNSFVKDGSSVDEKINKKPIERIYKIEKRLEDGETKEYKEWKLKGGSALDNVTTADMEETPVEAPTKEALFG